MDNSASDILRQVLHQLHPISDTNWKLLFDKCQHIDVKAGTELVKIGDPTDSAFVYFVCRGLLKTSYLDVSGKEITKGFVWEGRLGAPYVSMLTNRPSNINIVALEDSALVKVKKNDLFELFVDHDSYWQIIGRKITEILLIERELREFQLLTLKADKRYEEFQKQFPHLLKRIPQYEVASYLGITPVALSNIRRRNRPNGDE